MICMKEKILRKYWNLEVLNSRWDQLLQVQLHTDMMNIAIVYLPIIKIRIQ